MQMLRKTSKGIRPEFCGWSSYTQQACKSSLVSLFVVGRQVFKNTFIMIYCVFTEKKET